MKKIVFAVILLAAVFAAFAIAGREDAAQKIPQVAMITAAGSAIETAEASGIVTDLRALKAASAMFYAENGNADAEVEDLGAYMDNPAKFTAPPYVTANEGGTLWVGLDLDAAGKPQGVRGKLAGRAQAMELYESPSAGAPYNGGSVVWMPAR